MSETKRYRLVTRSDFDGLVCAVLLKHLDMIDEILFVHPKDMQDGKIAISDNDITTNLPYAEGVYMSFDHHSSEVARAGSEAPRAFGFMGERCDRVVARVMAKICAAGK